ncbi:MAG: bifunctional DNA-formamidopyrimidine glycosylase/DNA-(apurinic or apyrimidinic site) lyase [Planctomycetes bacterium]|nr:bifunctional DNA-formamidopyrimidine glycosylase/DNA-(apurinic or apyrimidinic site) lyase [Planctomycetota bacterium]
MPELPEARTIARRLDSLVAAADVRDVRLRRADMLRTGSPDDLAAMAGERLVRADTRGKYIVLHTAARRLVIQLGMAGTIRVCDGSEPTPPHTHLTIALADGREIRYRNVRRIASGLHVLPPGAADVGPLAALGPEAAEISADALWRAVHPRRRPIKSCLLDQSLLAGLGNIYTDESLCRADVAPGRPACCLRRATVDRLGAAIREVLAEAIAAGGSTLADANPFVDVDGAVGSFAAAHRVYGRGGLPCLRCDCPLTRITLAGRTTVYCPRCQT